MDNNKLIEELKKVKEWAINNLVGKKVYHEGIGKNITFTKKGIDHLIYDKTYPLKLVLIYHAVSLLKSSTLSLIEKNRKGRADIKNVYRLVNKFEYENQKYIVNIIIRETPQGLIYYDHGVTKEKNLNK